MASALVPESKDDLCTLCEKKYNRLRPSFCQCKHCSVPMCVDCMKEHHDELLQQAAQISHEYNGVQDLLKSKQNMVTDTAEQSVKSINHYFDSYIDDLRKTQKEMLRQIGQAQQDAQNYLSKIENTLAPLNTAIEMLQKADALRPTKFDNITEKLHQLEEQLNLLKVEKVEELKRDQPIFLLNFNCPSPPPPSSPQQAQAILDNVKSQSLLKTSYPIDRMASDGKNIMYTTTSCIENSGHDLLGYLQFNKANDTPDLTHPWNQSRIDDMIWWSVIQKFIGATIESIYTIDQTENNFKVLSVQKKRRPYVRIAANSKNFYIHCNTMSAGLISTLLNQIEIYSKEFYLERIIDANPLQYFCTSSSFCVTDHWVAALNIRKKKKSQVFQVNFFDESMNPKTWVNLGTCTESVEIRTDGNNLFFIATGKKLIHIVSPDGKTSGKIDLQNRCQCLGVLDDRRLACSSKDLRDIELVPF